MDEDRRASGGLLLKNLKLASHSILESMNGRSPCPNCKASRKFYCYTCYVPVEELKDKVPQVKLPLKIDIIKHPKEIDGKSTAVHAGLISPNDVTIYTFPCIPDFESSEKVVLVFPSKDAVKLDDIFKVPKDDKKEGKEDDKKEGKEDDKKEGVKEQIDSSFTRVVFIDSTWNQSNQIFRDERLKGLPCIILNSRETCFWRTQKDKPNTYLATIEAIYYFLVDYHNLTHDDIPYDGRYDNLLYFYAFMYKVVEKSNEEKKHEGMENIRKRKRQDWEEKIRNKKLDNLDDVEKEKCKQNNDDSNKKAGSS
ncbi:tRNA-uridine aminocarboxypropyltransferase 1-like [Antedon mediterranea]|uniref:tRNA-uridine aminocarboxypropyltransferase 1-like n=1 Tax=Antedon mediterranea TaxID=105859 RepID=UPI003AF74A7A